MSRGKSPYFVRFLIQFSTAALLALLILPSSGPCSTGSSTQTAGPRLVKERLSIPEQPEESSRPILRVHTIRPGDSLSGILGKSGISPKDALYIARKADLVYRLSKMRPGGSLELYFTPDGRGLQEVDYKVNARTRKVLYNGRVIECTQFKAPSTLASRKVKTRVPAVLATSQKPPERSFDPQASFRRQPEGPPAPQEARADRAPSPAVMDQSPMKLVASYAPGLPWDVANTGLTPYDFLAEGQLISPLDAPWDTPRITGDFPNPLKKQSVSNAKKGTSKGKGKKRLAHTKSRKDNRYRPFLKAPLAYRYISSGYTSCRIHPVTNIEQPHYGIDYAAPMGTPVRSVGPGTVIYVGWDGGFGKTIRIKHTGGITTHYGHLSRYAKGIRPGKRVKQGEVIGRVGMTGIATGPHLDYRVTHLGSFVNPARLHQYTRISGGKGKTRG